MKKYQFQTTIKKQTMPKEKKRTSLVYRKPN